MMFFPRFLSLFIGCLVLVSCTQNQHERDTPAGGTRAELAYQMALKLAEQGNCRRAMPIFVCLAGQGTGWEVAAFRAGKCAPLAAQLWQNNSKVRQQNPIDDTLSHRKQLKKIKLDFAFLHSPGTIRTEGFRQLRRAANANWPEAQALLATQLTQAGAPYQSEAKQWLLRYDANARRKIYGGNAIAQDIRNTLKPVATKPGSAKWIPVNFAAEHIQNTGCTRLLAEHQNAPRRPSAPDQDDGIEHTEPRLPTDPVDEKERDPFAPRSSSNL